ncbi:hypothetical protein GCM10008986_26160 [Salinibacillus aidingensis]|uniref:SLAP domain-containing protein n=1 Tax=Salinibacillus aidingensis TaxID=237684 RepID=A0ABP3LFU6_9BACI
MTKKQRLEFERSWNKNLSERDRLIIQQIFQKTCASQQFFTLLWTAVNYRSDFLVTVLIHNRSEQPLTFNNRTLRYVNKNQVIAEHTFQLRDLIIEPYTSVPWTFIFPEKNCYSKVTGVSEGYVENIL